MDEEIEEMFSSEAERYQNHFEIMVHAESDSDPEKCPCKGRGWVLSQVDVWVECPIHKGMIHPEVDQSEIETSIVEQSQEEVETFKDSDEDIPF